MRYTWPILGIFVARFLATAVFFAAGDGDLAWQRWLGRTIRQTGRIPRVMGHETFTAAGATWVPQEWLFSIVASLSTGAGWYVFAACAAVAAGAALFIGAVRAARSGAAPLALGVAHAFAGVALLESFGVRVQVFAWPLLALFLYLIELDSPIAYDAIAVAVLWSNVHASVMLAGPLALVAALGSFLDERWSVRTKRTLFIGVGSLIATSCNPLGIELPRYAIMLFLSPFKTMIAEWQHTNFGDGSFAFGSLPLLLAVIAFGIGGTVRWRDRCIVIMTAVLMFSAGRNIPVFAIACFPIVARSLSGGASLFSNRVEQPETKTEIYASRIATVFSLTATAVVAFVLIGQARTQAAPSADLQRALAVIRSLPGTHRVFCADFAWCSFLIGNSRERIFLDGRADPYPQAVWDDFATIVEVKPGWEKALRSRGTDVVVVDVKSSLEQVLELSHDWRSNYRNDTYRLWTLMPTLGLTAHRPMRTQ